MSRSFVSVASICALMALGACSQPSETATGGAAATDAATTTTASASGPVVEGAIPESCREFIAIQLRCANTLGASNPMSATIREQAEMARASYVGRPDDAALASTCTAAQPGWVAGARSMGC